MTSTAHAVAAPPHLDEATPTGIGDSEEASPLTRTTSPEMKENDMLTSKNTVQEWLDDAVGGPFLREILTQGGQ